MLLFIRSHMKITMRVIWLLTNGKNILLIAERMAKRFTDYWQIWAKTLLTTDNQAKQIQITDNQAKTFIDYWQSGHPIFTLTYELTMKVNWKHAGMIWRFKIIVGSMLPLQICCNEDVHSLLALTLFTVDSYEK